MRGFIIISGLLFLFSMKAQDNTKISKENKPFTIRAHVGIPRSITSKAFYVSFNGVYEMNISASFMMADNITVGVGYQNSLFVNSKQFRDPLGVNLNTKMESNSPMFRLGYDYFFKNDAYCSFAINTGYTYNKFTGRKIKAYDTTNTTVPTFACLFVQPEFSVNFIVEEHLAFNFMIAYNNQIAKYNQAQSGLKYYYDYQKYGDKYIISWITFGFGVNVLLGKNK